MPYIVMIITLFLSINVIYRAFTIAEDYVLAGDFSISGNNPVDEAEYIEKYFPKAHIGNSYNFGAYLLWRLWPANKVFFDSRHFPYKNWSDEYFASRSTKGLDLLLKKYPCDVWTFDHAELALSSYFRYSPKWKLAFYGRNGQVFIRKGLKLPERDHYRVSKNIFKLRSHFALLRIYLFALTINDWETAELISKKEINRFKNENKPHKVKLYRDLFAGIKAFSEKKFEVAVTRLGKYNTFVKGVGGYIVMSYLHLSQQSLNEDKRDIAFQYADMAAKLLPNTFYTQYNLGVTKLLLQNDDHLGKKSFELESYKNNFKNFLVLVNGNDALFAEEIDFAKGIIDDNIQMGKKKLNLLIPSLTTLTE
ncbi:hypothetical protein DGMP_17010 [Desulfomarina profundi]|uniref:Uncharacterized protein n=1 Tax=Desulfomarina profundi TaxID=2772557 RepID=A0A8D5JDF1_9BACT|nr:hypothetical protein DGMP_17010 [Desulfomarina profundi]